MKSEKLYDAITNIDDSLVNEAGPLKAKGKKRTLIYVAVSFAAAFVIVTAVGFLMKNSGLFVSTIIPDHRLPEVTTNQYTPEDITSEAVPSEEQTASAVTPENETSTVISEYLEPELTTAAAENIHINDGSKEVKPQTLAEAVYPEMAKYPALLGEISPSYDEWWEDIRELRKIEVATDNISAFSKSLMSEVLTSKNDENNILSPLNIYMALGILAETCDGNSRQQILDLLGAESIEELREQSNKIWQKNYRDDGYMKSIMANSLWLNDSILYKKSAINTIAEKYFASVYSGTMGSDKYNKMLNNWIKDNTGGLLSPELTMDYDTVMTIASALLYQTKWTDEFSESQTENGVFRSPTGDKDVSFMKKSDFMYYYWGEKFAAISLSLDIGGYMWFILPDEGIDADTMFSDEELLNLITLSSGGNNYEKSKFIEVHMSIPKFDVTSEQDILTSLKKLGITDIADGEKSDFSALATNPEGIFVGGVAHGVRVKIDEEGVSAAAYTVIPAAGSPAPPDDEVYFTLDRPFGFVITLDNATPLFAGVVNNP